MEANRLKETAKSQPITFSFRRRTKDEAKQGWVWILSLLIFFFNSFLLPEGLTLTLLLFPLWVYILYSEKRLYLVITLLIPLLFFMVVHLAYGVDVKYYLISLAMIIGLITFLLVFQKAVNNPLVHWDLIFRDITVLNFFFVLVSLLFLYNNVLKPVTWYLVPITPDIPVIPRLKLFASEASHYSFWLAPIALYFYSRKLFFKTQGSWFTLAIVTIPLLLSFSFGVMAAIIISFIILLVIYFRQIMVFRGNRQLLISISLIFIGLLLFAWYRYPNNVLFLRLHDIMKGNDTSARGRTYEAFILAKKIIAQKNEWFGIGLGQLKLIGRSIIVQYYSYSNIPTVIRIPNATAETLVYFGYTGLALRFLIEIFCFFKTKVYQNPYRLWLFLFVFIYQFTGSYITNAAEYIVWILAFSNIFPEFSLSQIKVPILKETSKKNIPFTVEI